MKKVVLLLLVALVLGVAGLAAIQRVWPDRSAEELINVLQRKLAPPQEAQSPATGKAAGGEPGTRGGSEPARVAWTDLDRDARRFYEKRGFHLAWLDQAGPGQAAKLMIEALRHAGDEGLDEKAYSLDAIDRSIESLGGGVLGRGAGPEQRADLDILMTTTFLRYASDLARGRLDLRASNKEWHLKPSNVDPVTMLDEALRSGGIPRFLEGLPPPHPEYARLKKALATYRASASSGGWPTVPAEAPLRIGQRGAGVSALRRRLAATGDLAGVNSGTRTAGDRFDRSLEQAVRAFQRRHGLEETGVVDRGTLAEINVPIEERIRQIRINMDRWRWVPRTFGDDSIVVNIPGFSLDVRKGDRSALSMRVVAGKGFTPTPAFSDEITYLVLNPSWNIPESIVKGEIVPAAQKDPDYLSKKGIRVLDGFGEDAREITPSKIQWASLGEKVPYAFRQDPGPENPLGQIKFMMPNQYDVYLHDTPADHLFHKAERALSHGCIRVEKPIELAAYLLEGTPWTRESLLEAIKSGDQQDVPLPRPFPVHIIYMTAWADDDGTVEFREDIYGFDRSTEPARPEGTSLG